MEKRIISVAVVGSHPTKSMNPAVPYTPKEIAVQAIESYRAGASIVHIHVRDPITGKPTSRIDLFAEVVERIREACDVIINLTTSGYNIAGSDITKRLEPLKLSPDMCSLDLGSINFSEKVFLNPPDWGVAAAKRIREQRIKPEIEVFEAGHIRQAVHLINQGLFEEPVFIQLCMGVGWGIEATPENLLHMKNLLPEGSLWSVLGVGKSQLPMTTMGLVLGGNVRVGFEDNLYFRKGELLKNNAQMVEHVASLIEHLHYGVATPSEARKLLKI